MKAFIHLNNFLELDILTKKMFNVIIMKIIRQNYTNWIKIYHNKIDKYKVAANITEYFIISKLIFLRIIISKFMMLRQLFHVKIFVKI